MTKIWKIGESMDTKHRKPDIAPWPIELRLKKMFDLNSSTHKDNERAQWVLVKKKMKKTKKQEQELTSLCYRRTKPALSVGIVVVIY